MNHSGPSSTLTIELLENIFTYEFAAFIFYRLPVTCSTGYLLDKCLPTGKTTALPDNFFISICLTCQPIIY